MKKLFILSSLWVSMAGVALCQKTPRSSSVSRSSRSGENGKYTYLFSDSDLSLKIEISGEITFSEDETTIAAISKGGYLKYKNRKKSIKAESGAGGEIIYEMYDGSQKLDFDDNGKNFLAEAIGIMMQHGVDAKGRVERLYKRGGSKAVLNETEALKSDYVKGIFLGFLLEKKTLSPEEMTLIADKTARIIESDYEKGKLLSRFSGDYLKNIKTAQAYLAAVKSIDSDYEKANALKIILNQELNARQFTQVMDVAGDIGSDYEKANVLKALLDKNEISTDVFPLLLAAVEKMDSDYEKANVLEMLLKRNNLPAVQYVQSLKAVRSINSDYEKANVLKMLAGKKLEGDDAWTAVIQETALLSSDYEKSNVLIKIAEDMPQTEKVKNAYMKAAKTINSDYEYGKVVRVVRVI